MGSQLLYGIGDLGFEDFIIFIYQLKLISVQAEGLRQE